MAGKKTIRIGHKTVGAGHPVFIIAEAGVNHNRSLRLAKKLVDIAAKAGADAVKFQTWNVDALYASDEVTGNSYRSASKKRCLPYAAFVEIQKYCKKKGVIFISTPDEEASADFLSSLKVPAFKVGSGDLINLPFLEYVAKKRKPVILSTGMGSDAQVAEAIREVSRHNKELIILHCISSYPTPPSEAAMPRVTELRKRYGIMTGYSDHTLGSTAAILAVGEGAAVIEKHFTFDKKALGPDHCMSLSPSELKGFVQVVREAEAMRLPKQKSRGEAATKKFAWKSAVARCGIQAGERLSLANVVFKRPGLGVTVDQWKKIVGKRARRAISEGHFIKRNDIQ
jgi:sialic acid synthase SpsE